MIDPFDGWMAQVDSYGGLMTERLVIARRNGDRSWDYIEGFLPTGEAVITRTTEDVRLDGFQIPRGVLRAIAEAVKPGPDSKEVARLEEALKVERARVDQVLDRMWR